MVLRRRRFDYEQAADALNVTELEARRAAKAWKERRFEDAETYEQWLAAGNKPTVYPAVGTPEHAEACEQRRRQGKCPTQPGNFRMA